MAESLGSTFAADCPFCNVQRVGFVLKDMLYVGRPSKYAHRPYAWHIFAMCGHCRCGVLAEFHTDNSNDFRYYSIISGTLLSTPTYNLEKLYPSPPDKGSPRHTPEKVDLYYTQGRDNELRGNWDAAGGMFRRALETALKEKFPDLEDSLNLYKRIEEAAKQHRLTPELAEWSGQIRLFGNEAMHGDAFEEKDAKATSEITRLILIYLFTLPAEIEEAKKSTQPPKPSKGGGAKGGRI